MKDLRYRTRREFERRKLLSVLFYTISGGFIAGVAYGSWISSHISHGIFFLFLASIFFLLFLTKGQRKLSFVAATLVCAALFLGIFRIYITPLDPTLPSLESKLSEEVRIEGVAVDEPISNEGKQTVILDPLYVDGARVDAPRVRLTLDLYPKITFGEKIIVKGELEKPEDFETETGRVFDYTGYLSKDGIGYVIYYPEILSQEPASLSLRGALFSIRRVFLDNISRVIPEPHGALVGGVTVGAEEALGSEREEKLRTTGLIHIVVLSGYNVAIIAHIIVAALGMLSPVISLIVAVSSIAGFALLTGASATIIRASLMAALVVLSRFVGRSSEVTRLLLLAGLLMLLHNPLILRYDPSFQLSFLATLGLIYVSPRIEEKLGWVPDRYNMKEIVVATLSTYIFVLPLLLYMTGELSLVSLPANLLVLPVVPILMATGFLVFVVSIFSLRIGIFSGLVAVLLSGYIFKVVDVLALLPFASVTVGSIPVWLLILVYVLYAVFLLKQSKREVDDLHKK